MTMLRSLIVAALVPFFAAGCTVHAHAGRGGAGAPPAAQSAAGWERLGARQVDFRADHDAIPVGARDGRFRAIRLDVHGAPLAMDRIVVHFANGEHYAPPVRHLFDERSASRRIDLPAGDRVVTRVDFFYRSAAPRHGKATLALFGQH